MANKTYRCRKCKAVVGVWAAPMRNSRTQYRAKKHDVPNKPGVECEGSYQKVLSP